MVLGRDQVAKLKIANFFFPGMFVGDSRKSMLVKISRYTVIILIFKIPGGGEEFRGPPSE